MSMEKSVNPRLWHACAGGLIQMPLPDSYVYYFPQGHAEHTLGYVDFTKMPRVVPSFVLCKVIDVKFLADFETDEVYGKIRLVPVGDGDVFQNCEVEDEVMVRGRSGFELSEKPSSFAKTLTQSDANNGGGFSVPRYCAEMLFPSLDYSVEPPIQTVVAKDVHGEIWKFRHIYRGTPRRHLLTTGWSTFVNHKKLVAGDSVVFVRTEDGDLCIGIRRAKRGDGGRDSLSGWNSYSGNSASFYGGFSSFLHENENKLVRSTSKRNINSSGRGKVRPEDVIEAASLAANGQSFEVAYYPRASTPEFFVKASSLTASLSKQWCAGMRFKMAFETEDSSRISWFMGTVSSVEVADPFHWPNSPWRLLQVSWDEPDLLQNVKRVSPWLVETVSSLPLIQFSPFSPQRKKLRLPQPPDLPRDIFTLSSCSDNHLGRSSLFCCQPENLPASIQGARHARFGIPLSDLKPTHKLHLGLFPSTLKDLHGPMDGNTDDVSCLLTMGNSSPKLDKSDEKVKAPLFLLFGQPIHIDQPISSDHYSSQAHVVENSSNKNGVDFFQNQGPQTSDIRSDYGHCKVFLGSGDMGRTLDLSILKSYEELRRTLANLLGIETFDNSTNVLYKNSTGDVKRIGDEPFSEFVREARRLTIPLDACNLGDKRKWNTSLKTAEHGLDSRNQTCPMTIFAL